MSTTISPESAPAVAPIGPVTPSTGRRTSRKAIAALVLGALSLVVFGTVLGVPAIVFGGHALRDMRSDGALGGRRVAIAGIVLGTIGIVASWVVTLTLR